MEVEFDILNTTGTTVSGPEVAVTIQQKVQSGEFAARLRASGGTQYAGILGTECVDGCSPAPPSGGGGGGVTGTPSGGGGVGA
eukprot:2968490-Rhodomonas_salina.1